MKIQSTMAGGNKPIQFQNEFNHISPYDLEEIMEYLKDHNYLSKEGIEFRHEFWELFIKKIDEQDLQLEDHNFRVNSDGWKAITVDNKRYLVNPENDIWEILEEDYKGEQLFTWDAAIRETKKAGKRMPTDEEFSELLKTKDDMLNVVYSGYRDTASPWFNNRGTFATLWSSTQSSTNAWFRYLYSADATVYRNATTKASGFSVRCVKN